VHETSIDGVATFWEQGPEPLTGALLFRAGARHETFRTVQVAHLVEHLVMGTLPKSHVDYNAHVDIDTTTFVATGKPAEVADFLERVCRALAEVPMDRLEREQGVLAAEDSSSAHPALCWAAGVRFGHTGPGLLNSTGPGVRGVTAEQVRAFAADHFVRENAVLVFTGPPPEGLSLPLKGGPRPEEEPGTPTQLPTPCVMRVPPFPVLSAVLPRQLWATTVARILVDRLTDDVRQERGLAYEIGLETARLDDDHTLFVVFTDGAEKHADAIAQSLWTTLEDLAEQGPSDAELAHHLAGFTAYTQDPRASGDWMEGVAYRHLYGEPQHDREQAIASLSRIGAADVQRWAREALDTAVLGAVPHGGDDGGPIAGLRDLTEWMPDATTPTRDVQHFGRKLISTSPRDLAVTVGSDGLSQTVRGSTTAGSWNEVVGVARADGVRLVHLKSATSLLLWDRHLKNGDRLMTLVDEHAGGLVFDSTEDEILGDD
jgi:predicted Zn-dependent peptidase